MSSNTEDELDALSDALEIRETIVEETNKLEDRRDNLESLIQETKSTLEESEGQDQQTIVDTYSQSLKENYKRLSDENESFALGDYETDLKDFIEDFQSVLRHPEAESAVEAIEDWLVGAGASPFENKDREQLIKVVERDVERVESANTEAQEAFEILKTDLSTHRDSLAKLIKDEIAGVGSISGIQTIASEIDSLSTRWPYPCDFDIENEPGPAVSKRVDDLLLSRIQNIIEESDSFEQFVTLSRERLFELDNDLDEIENVVATISGVLSSLENSNFGDSVQAGQDILTPRLSNANSIADVRTAVRESKSIVNIMNDVKTEQIERFDASNNDIPEFIEQDVSDINDDYDSLVRIRKAILTGDVERYDSNYDEFNDKIGDAEKKLERVKNCIEREISTGKDITDTFGLDEKSESLGEIQLAVSRSETVEELLEHAKECSAVREEIRDLVTESYLDEDEAKVFEVVLEQESEMTDSTSLIDSIAKETNKSRVKVLEIILELQDEELLSIRISGA